MRALRGLKDLSFYAENPEMVFLRGNEFMVQVTSYRIQTARAAYARLISIPLTSYFLRMFVLYFIRGRTYRTDLLRPAEGLALTVVIA